MPCCHKLLLLLLVVFPLPMMIMLGRLRVASSLIARRGAGGGGRRFNVGVGRSQGLAMGRPPTGRPAVSRDLEDDDDDDDDDDGYFKPPEDDDDDDDDLDYERDLRPPEGPVRILQSLDYDLVGAKAPTEKQIQQKKRMDAGLDPLTEYDKICIEKKKAKALRKAIKYAKPEYFRAWVPDAIIAVQKPAGWTSHDVVEQQGFFNCVVWSPQTLKRRLKPCCCRSRGHCPLEAYAFQAHSQGGKEAQQGQAAANGREAEPTESRTRGDARPSGKKQGCLNIGRFRERESARRARHEKRCLFVRQCLASMWRTR
jgi:hypothetical protein